MSDTSHDPLEVYIERRKREARRKWSSRTGGRLEELRLSGYWEGQYVALVKLQRRLERIVKAQPNDRSERPEAK